MSFCSPDVCFAEARKTIPDISSRRGIDPLPVMSYLEQLPNVVEIVVKSAYEEYESSARARIGHRDADDWPVVATSLLLGCPVWTEDHDFFGSGLSTWTTQTIELYLRDA
ncbi:MAG: PIN domain-containing protein [Acidobacteriaceae bacterium]|nr:PIN domain-containing protein [Acidobacteriaceae bacterium]